MTFGPSVRYPAGPITPHGAYQLMSDRIPHVALRSYDNSIVFNLMGPLSIADRTIPERVELKNIKGLIAPWKIIDQKGATQDGTTFVDSLYDPMEVSLDVNCVGRNPEYLRRVVSHLINSIDTKQLSELSWYTHEMGRWWAPVRWNRPSDDQLSGGAKRSQQLKLQLRCDDGFWRTYPACDQFRFVYDDNVDEFEYLIAEGDPVTGWTTQYSGAGTGSLYVDGDQALTSFQGARTVVARRTSYTCGADNMVVSVQLGTNSQPTYPENTYIDLWARMANSGTAGADGIRCRLGLSTIRLSSFVSGSETVIREQGYGGYWSNWWFWWFFNAAPAPYAGEKFTLVCGTEDDARTYKVLRNGSEIFTAKETGTTSNVGSSYRKAGFGEATGSGLIRPLGVRRWSAGVNATSAQDGYLVFTNPGDQDMWPRYTLFGPGTFWIAGGPSSSDMVKIGPLLPNQIVQVRTDPRKRGVIDMSTKPTSSQSQAEFTQAYNDYLSFLSTGGTAPLSSVFGVLTPTGNPYQLMSGRFAKPIPAKSPGAAPTLYHVACRIDNGNQDSQIIGSGTPLRRLPY